MSENIPEFLIEMSKQMNSQDNRITADPLFEVRHKSYLVTEQGYGESHYEISSEDGVCLYHSERSDSLESLAEHLIEYHEGWCYAWCEDAGLDADRLAFLDCFPEQYDPCGWVDLPDEIRKVHMQEIEVTVNSHFTEASAQKFIDRKQHDYPKLYIYAISLCFCEDMKKLRNWILSLSHEAL